MLLLTTGGLEDLRIIKLIIFVFEGMLGKDLKTGPVGEWVGQPIRGSTSPTSSTDRFNDFHFLSF